MQYVFGGVKAYNLVAPQILIMNFLEVSNLKFPSCKPSSICSFFLISFFLSSIYVFKYSHRKWP